MGHSHKSKHDRRRSRSRTPSSRSSSSASSASRTRTRSRSRSRTPSRHRHSRHHHRHHHRHKRTKRERSRSRSRSRSPSVKRESSTAASSSSSSTSRAAAAAATSTAAQPALSSSDEQRRIKAEEKARMKATETAEERRQRRLAKKAAKHGTDNMDVTSASAASAGAGYSDHANPFNDASLAKPFIWKKKYEKAIEEGADPRILTKSHLYEKQSAAADEIAAIKARRAQREDEKAAMDALREQMNREAAMEQVDGWEEKEEEFHRTNAAQRTIIRLAEGRPKLIDVLAKNRSLLKTLRVGPSTEQQREHPEWHGCALDPALPSERDVELTEPQRVLVTGAMPWRDLQMLLKDIEEYQSLSEEADRRYWHACHTLCMDAFVKGRAAALKSGHIFGTRADRQYAESAAAGSAASENNRTSSGAVQQEVNVLLRGKTLSELEILERDIQQRLSGRSEHQHAASSIPISMENMDHSYWDTLLQEMQLVKASAYLRESHMDVLRTRLNDLRHFIQVEERRIDEQRRQRIEAGMEDGDASAGGSASVSAGGDEDFEPAIIPEDEFISAPGSAADANAQHAAMTDDDGSLSPMLITDDGDALDRMSGAPNMTVVDADADARELAQRRAQVAAQKRREQDDRMRLMMGQSIPVPSVVGTVLPGMDGAAPAATATGDSTDAYERESARPMEGDEVRLRTDFALPAQEYWWADRYRPRKPQYFNRVKIGFDWNRYNSVHYDRENPPPKIVQGYKFNIFYPDLIDTSVTPRFRLEPDPEGNLDFAVIRFMAGPPYEDVAFKIVNKEWEYGKRRGFRIIFDRGVMMVWFNFKRYFYFR